MVQLKQTESHSTIFFIENIASHTSLFVFLLSPSPLEQLVTATKQHNERELTTETDVQVSVMTQISVQLPHESIFFVFSLLIGVLRSQQTLEGHLVVFETVSEEVVMRTLLHPYSVRSFTTCMRDVLLNSELVEVLH